ncbi:MAG TPA: hypothetical protein VFV99_20625 [Kofleriaceae bacterium]|nr:hypothetical protein [Kofleriaceae bacterium]
MKRTLGLVLAVALVPAIANAQSADPYDPQTPTPTTPDTTSTTTVVTPPPQQPAPVVVVPPAQEPPRTTIVTQQPESYEVVDQWNAPVFATGALVFAGSYGASAIVAASSDHPGADRLYVPVVGPWLALNDWGDCPIDEPRCDTNTTHKVLLVADGVFQAGGVITMITGLLSPTTHTVYQRTADATKVRVTPTHNGFAVVGRW